MSMPKPEHPFPQFERKNFINLNGRWEFEFDFGKSGLERKFYSREHLNSDINVPFCPESKLSGVGYVDFMPAVWYRRDFEVPRSWENGNVLLHFGAVDYASRVYINGTLAAAHRGGYSPFSADITKLLRDGKNSLCVCAEDATAVQPRGKQCARYYSGGCEYTRTTGIWQTVWLELVPETHVESAKYFPDISASSLGVELNLSGGATLELKASYEGKTVGALSRKCEGGRVCVTLPLSELRLWEPGHGRLYDLEIRYGEDSIKSYFGMREVRLEGRRFLINGKAVFQRLVLDQGFYPDGVYTAPSDSDLENDVLLSLSLGFNGARLHQKVFEPRFLYHCDRHGYIVWGEYPSWGLDTRLPDAFFDFSCEWPDIVARDFSHPSIIGWCPFNETWDGGQLAENVSLAYRLTKALDPTRPCLDSSGGFHVETDVYDFHDYAQEPAPIDYTSDDAETFMKRINGLRRIGNARFGGRSLLSPLGYGGDMPIFLSEYGGICWDADAVGGWGYGNRPQSPEEFLSRYQKLTDVLLDCPHLFGFCYTQLYDVEQEVNGLCTYPRKPKFDPEFFKKVNSRRAKYEE